MLYNIHISQIALTDIGIDTLDYNDLAIFNAIEYMCASNNITKQVIKSKQYSLISWKLIVKQLPFLQHNSRATIKSRIKKLEEAGLIEPSPDNTILQNSYYRMGDLYDDYKVKKQTPYSKNEHPVQNLEQPRPENKTAPVQNLRRNNSIKDNSINNNNSGVRVSFKDFQKLYPSNLDEQKAYNYFYSSLTDDEKLKAIRSVPTYLKYLEASNKQAYLKAPANYLKDKTFNTDFVAEINRIEKYSKKPEPEPNSRFKEIM